MSHFDMSHEGVASGSVEWDGGIMNRETGRIGVALNVALIHEHGSLSMITDHLVYRLVSHC